MSVSQQVTAEDRLAKAAVVIRRLKERIAELERETVAQSEPVAVIGVGCRFPGGADSPEAFWSVLESGRDAVVSLEPRWELVGQRPSAGAPSWGGLLTSPVDAFDPQLFGISAREARAMDPQHRLLLEVAWEALEHASILPRSLEGSATGVFIGACAADYQQVVSRLPSEELDLYTTTGNMLSVAAGRVAYTFGFQGPSLMIDTACSSSLVSVHLAARSLRERECDLALAGGVNLLLSPMSTEAGWRMQALSPDGRCRTFDAGANGFVRGEGCGLVVLKRLADARRDGDRIVGLIRASAVNQDGRSTGLTAPNVLAQEALLRQALRAGRVDPQAVGFVETHGTGTSLGDPIEIEALRAVVGGVRPGGGKCVLGALKTQFGHLEGAAGVAGLVKVLLALQHERIPRNLNFRTLNPRIRLEDSALAPATEAVAWPRGDRPRVAGVSSFGLSGTNAHVLVEEAPARAPSPTVASAARTAELVVVSGRTGSALQAQAERLARHCDGQPAARLGDLAFSAATTRTAMEERLAVVATSTAELASLLRAAAAGESAAGIVRGAVGAGARPKIVFVFPGQGSQWVGMGRTLLAEEPAFRAAIEDCDRAIRAEADFSVLEELAAEASASRLDRIDVVQPVLFAVEVALTRLWRAWGVEPDAVVGHSMGEIAAAHVAGALSLEDAAAIICRRSRLLRRISGKGAMALVELTVPAAAAALEGFSDRLSVAVSNSPRFTVISGEPEALAAVLSALEARGVFTRRVKVDVASHSPQVDPLRDDLIAALAAIAPRPCAVPMRSTVTGDLVDGKALTAAYWAENVRQPVLFAQAARALIDDGHTLFVEMSPHPLLVPSVEEILGDAERTGAAVGCLRRDQPERPSLLEALGTLWVHGATLPWAALFPATAERVPLPTYAWGERERYWLDAFGPVARGASASGHPLLGERTASSWPGGATCWTTEISLKTLPYLEEHRVAGQVVFPAAGYIEMALKAAAEETGGPAALEGLQIDEALLLREDERRVLQLALGPAGPSERPFHVASAPLVSGKPGQWTVHARGAVASVRPEDGRPGEALASVQRRVSESWESFEGAAFYDVLATVGLEYGESFRGVRRGRRQSGEALAELALVGDAARRAGSYEIHPALLDAALQVIAAASGSGDGAMYLPAGVGRIRVERPVSGWSEAGTLWAHARAEQRGGELVSDLSLCDGGGVVLARIEGFRAKRVQGTDEASERERWLHEIQWEPQVDAEPGAGEPEAATSRRNWIVLGAADGDVVQEVADALAAQGGQVLRVTPGAPGEVAAYTRLFDELPADFCQGGWGIVHALGLDDGAPDGEGGDGLGWRSLLALVKAAATPSARAERPRLVVLTRDARAAAPGDRVSGAWQAPLVGLCKTIVQEHPELACLTIDLPGPKARALDEADVRALAVALTQGGREEEIALRGGRRWVPRLVRVTPPSGDASGFGPLQPDGVYLVTGGFGGIGLSLGRWLARHGARHIALLGRRSPSAAATAVIDELRGTDVRVSTLEVDVTRQEDLERAVAALTAAGGPIRGVFHLAGCLDNGVLANLDEARFARVLEPKLRGTANLERATAGQPLDMFVLFSSVASVFGAPGQANHAAANAFLDAFAAARTAGGARTLSLNWGAWGELGEAAAEKAAAYVASRGLRAMAPEDALHAFSRAWAIGGSQLAIVGFERGGPAERAILDRPLFARLAPELAARQRPGGDGDGLTRAKVLAAPADARARLVTTFLRDLVAAQTGFAKAKLDVHRPLTSLGLDSLMTLRLKNRIESSLGASVPATLFLQGATTAQLALHINGLLGDAPAAAVEAENSGAPVRESAAAARAAQRKALHSRRAGSR